MRYGRTYVLSAMMEAFRTALHPSHYQAPTNGDAHSKFIEQDAHRRLDPRGKKDRPRKFVQSHR